MTKILDTSVLVDIDRGDVDERVARLDDEGRHAVSVVTLTELRLGVNRRYEPDSDGRADAHEALARLLARVDVLDLTRPIASTAADLIDDLRRRGVSLHDLHDVYIAATSRVEGLAVLTADVSHFERIEGVEVVDWRHY